MHPRNMTAAEILTEAESRHAADPLIAALVKMAAGTQSSNAIAQVCEAEGLYDADEVQKALAELENWRTTAGNIRHDWETPEDLAVGWRKIQEHASEAKSVMSALGDYMADE